VVLAAWKNRRGRDPEAENSVSAAPREDPADAPTSDPSGDKSGCVPMPSLCRCRPSALASHTRGSELELPVTQAIRGLLAGVALVGGALIPRARADAAPADAPTPPPITARIKTTAPVAGFIAVTPNA